MPETVIINTSCLIALNQLGQVDLLCKLYNKVIVPVEVIDEFPELHLPCFSVVEVNEKDKSIFVEELNLGKDEMAVMSLALKTGNVCIIDDLKARKIAFKIGLKLTGTIGILLRAEKRGLIKSAFDEIRILKSKGFYVSEALLNKLKKIE